MLLILSIASEITVRKTEERKLVESVDRDRENEAKI